jgi:nitrite transporter NirC
MATVASGVMSRAPVKEFVLGVVAAKMSAPAGELFFRAVLCNMLVCLAVWMGLRTKSESARLVLIFWCLFAFIGSGFEHSVANMTLLGIGMFLPHDPALVSWAGFARNMTLVTAGNIVGGALLIGLPYWFVAQAQRPVLAVRPVEEPVAVAAVP